MLELAVALGSSNLVQLLLDAGATVTSEENLVPPLVIAVLHRHRGNVQLLEQTHGKLYLYVLFVTTPGTGLGSCHDVNMSMQCKYPLHRAQRIRWLTYSPKAETLWII